MGGAVGGGSGGGVGGGSGGGVGGGSGGGVGACRPFGSASNCGFDSEIR